MGLRFDPIGGGRFKQFVQQVIEAERAPVRAMEARKGNVEAKMQLFQTFKAKFNELGTALRDISSFEKLREFKVDVGDGEGLIDVSINKDLAQPGSYMVEINELAARSSMISNGFEDPNAKELGIGFVVVNLPNGDDFEVFIDDGDASLYGVAQLINDVDDSPVQATVIKDVSDPDEPWRLILTAKDDGVANGVAFPEFYFLDGRQEFWIEDERDSQNAFIAIDDYPIEAESNDIPDFIQGVNVHLKQARPEAPFSLTISEDFEKVSEKVGGLVTQINEVLGFINEQNAVDESSDTRTMFTGDTGLQSIEYRLRNLLHEGFPTGRRDRETGEFTDESFKIVWLHQLGITFSREGTVAFDENKFNNAMEKDFDAVGQAISGEFGFAYQLGEVINAYTRPLNGLLAVREQGLRNRIDQIDQNIENKERVLEQRAANLTAQFSRLQSTLGNLQQQQQFVSANLGAPTGGIQQLLGG